MNDYQKKIEELLGTVDNMQEAQDMLDSICSRLESNNWEDATFYVLGSKKQKYIKVLPKFTRAIPCKRTLCALTIVGTALDEFLCLPPIYAASRMVHLQCYL